jgi:hypothetical protein
MITFKNYPPVPQDVEFSEGCVLKNWESANRLNYEDRKRYGRFIGSFIFSNLDEPSRSNVIASIENAVRIYPESADTSRLMSDLTTGALEFVNGHHIEQSC